VDPRPDGAELHVQGGRDLLVGEALDVAEHHGGPELRRQGVERGLDVVVEVVVLPGALGALSAPGEAVAGVLGEGVEPDALLAAHLVEEQVGGDRCSQPSNVPGV
jgi:hypothetical protein